MFKIFAAFIVFSAWSLEAALPADVSELIATKLELDTALKAYDAKEKECDDAIEPTIKDAIARHLEAMVVLQNKHAGGSPTLAPPIDSLRSSLTKESLGLEARNHLKHVNLYGRNLILDKKAALEIQTAWARVLNVIANAERSVFQKRAAAKQELLGVLSALDRSYVIQKDVVGRELIARIAGCIAIRKSVEANRLDFTALKPGGPYSVNWHDVANEGGYIVGFEGVKIPAKAITFVDGQRQELDYEALSITPVFASSRATRNGRARGAQASGATPERIISKDGYAVGGLIVRLAPWGSCVGAVKVVFSRIQPNGVSLDAKDSYMSEWLGGDVAPPLPGRKMINPQTIELKSSGRMVIGVHGGTDSNMDSLGLIYLK